MISFSFELGELASTSMNVKSMSRPPDGPSSCIGLLPLSWIHTCAEEEGETPSTLGGDNTRAADEVNETPSTPGGDSTRRDVANKTLWPRWYVTYNGALICSISGMSS